MLLSDHDQDGDPAPVSDHRPRRRRFVWGRRFPRHPGSDDSHLTLQPFEGHGPIQEPDPEDFIPSPRPPRSPLTVPFSFQALWPALWAYAAFWGISWVYWNNDRLASRLYASHQSVFEQGEYWRLVTALGAHADVVHILSNGPLFLIFATLLYAYFGRYLFPGLAFVAGIVANAITVWYYPPQVQLVGVSGMDYAMVAMWLVLYLRFEASLALGQKALRAVGFALLMLIPSTYEPQVSYLAHAMGFMVGLLLTLAVSPFLTPKRAFTGES